MKVVNIYTYSTAKSPRVSKCEAVGYVIEMKTAKGDATAGDLLTVKNMTRYQSELHVLEKALSRINTMCEVHVYTECEYVAAGFEQGWLDQWMRNDWKTASNKEVSHKEEWQALIALVQQYDHYIVFHVKEKHSHREWLKTNSEKRKAKCLTNLESSTQRKK